MSNILIGLGNTGSQIVKVASRSTKLNDLNMFVIDSVTSAVDLDTIGKVTFIPIVSDDKQGSGRNRDRGAAMFKFHESKGEFDEMYSAAESAKSPILVVTSAAGGTGSGSIVPLCKHLLDKGLQVIPIIVTPALEDPDAYQLNTADLMLELQEIGIETYSIFRNKKGDANYGPVNERIVELIEIILGRHYDTTDLDSIDDSDLENILSTPGRFIAMTAEECDVESLRKEITRRVFVGYQPSWTAEEAAKNSLMTAFSLTSMYASQDFKGVFSDINDRIVHVYDEYRNIKNADNDGIAKATIIVAGLPRAELKVIDSEFTDVAAIGAGMKRSKRPNFLARKKATVTDTPSSDGSQISKFNWK